MVNRYKYGEWRVNGVGFNSSYEAYLFASQQNSDVNFFYNHESYKNFDVSLLGKVSLNELYRIRAQKLRDTYDYLILYYSGGADSHNVLRTFLDNNIKLDEICVKWPKPLREGKLYTPNTTDISAKNIVSEWDYAVKPILDYLAQKHPEIKITFKDYAEHPDKLNIDEQFEHTNNHQFMLGILLNSVVSDSEKYYLERGKTVANIYGINKPMLAYYDNKVYMFFSDNALRTCVTSTINPYGGECFYWDPDMPIIAYEQAYQTALHYKVSEKDRKFLVVPQHKRKNSDDMPGSLKIAVQELIAKKHIYTTFDNRFQAFKPTSPAKLDFFSWFYESNEFSRQKDIFHDNVMQRLQLVNERFLTSELDKWNKKIYTLDTLVSPHYYITDIF